MLAQEGSPVCSTAFYNRTPVDWTELLTNKMLTEHQNCRKSGL